jgi:hypothetical protein
MMSKDPWEKCVRAAHNTINSTKNKTLAEAQHAGLSSSQRSTELSSHFLQFICGTLQLQLARPWLTGTLGLGFKTSSVHVKFLPGIFYWDSLGVFPNSLAVGSAVCVPLKKKNYDFFFMLYYDILVQGVKLFRL